MLNITSGYRDGDDRPHHRCGCAVCVVLVASGGYRDWTCLLFMFLCTSVKSVPSFVSFSTSISSETVDIE